MPVAPRSAPRPLRRLGVLAAVVVLLAACAGRSDITLERADPGPTTTAPATTVVSGGTTTTVPAPPALTWEDCSRDRECATLEVPLDYANPAGGTIELGVARVPARGDRIGALFLNFGGPGGDAAETIGFFPVPDEIRERFDIVGMDPRGVGMSTPLGCGIDAVELYAVDPTVEDQADADALIEVSRRYAADCDEARGSLLPHLGTRNVARDMDQIRAAMGDEQISYLGFSYGTSVGQAYAELFPNRVRAMILDGVVDPAPDGITVATTQAKGFETALANWAEDCPNRSSCDFDDPIAAVEGVIAAAEQGVSGGDRVMGPGEVATGLAYPLYAEFLWGDLDEAIAEALAGDGGAMVELADEYTGIVDFSIYFAVSCLDSTWPADTAAFLAAAEQANAVAPHFGEALVNDYVRCAVWPTPPQPLGAITAPGTPPILVVSTTGDPATPYENGVIVADRLASGVLFTNDGEGHTIVFQGKDCVDDVAVDYLVDGTVPSDGEGC